MAAEKTVLNVQALHEKYRAERDKRLRADGAGQYVGIEDDSNYGEDPFAETEYSRPAVQEEIDAVIIGGGLGGLITASNLVKSGIQNFRIIEKASDFGGVWYWNRYPGARCDIEAYIYMPLLEEVGRMPPEKYARSSVIRDHAKAIGEGYDLYDKTLFRTKVTEARWDIKSSRWILTTNRGDLIRTRFLCLACGQFHRPKLPKIAGMNDFKGRSFHTSRWDYGYTGGDEMGNLDKLKDKRVALIGTGATAIQVMEPLSEYAAKLYAIQRTPPAIGVRNNGRTDPAWWATLEPGWQEKRAFNFESFIVGRPQDVDMVSDGWTQIYARLFPLAKDSDIDASEQESVKERMQMADYEVMQGLRERVAAIVKDKKTAESLKPYYNLGCKRALFHDEYLEAFNRSNVQLIDTDGKGIERITENAVFANGKAYEVDCIIYATGFEVAVSSDRTGSFNLIGKSGKTLDEHHHPQYRSLHGIFFNDFPNLALIGGLKGSFVTSNVLLTSQKQSEHVAKILSKCLEEGVEMFEPHVDAEIRWRQVIKEKSMMSVAFLSDCTPGYYNNEGNPDGSTLWENIYGGGPFEGIEILARWLADGSFERDMDIRHRAPGQ